jgi:hypothetical protein
VQLSYQTRNILCSSSQISICHGNRLPLNGIFVAHRSCSLETPVSLFPLIFRAYFVDTLTPFPHVYPSEPQTDCWIIEFRTMYSVDVLNNLPKYDNALPTVRFCTIPSFYPCSGEVTQSDIPVLVIRNLFSSVPEMCDGPSHEVFGGADHPTLPTPIEAYFAVPNSSPH